MGYTAGPAAEAEVAYHKDLQWNQQNPWSTFGLYQALQTQGKGRRPSSSDASSIHGGATLTSVWTILVSIKYFALRVA